MPDPLGLYFRAGRNDQAELLNLVAAGDASCFGVVFDPTLIKSQKELRDQILANRLDAILDPRTQPAAMPGGYTEALGKLAWGGNLMHRPANFTGTPGRRRISALGDFVLEHGFTQVLAPTHLLHSVNDDWLDIDLENVRWLKNHLDRRNGGNIPIVYSLAITYAMLRDPVQRQALLEALRSVPISAIWLKVDGFGSDSSATATRAYLNAARDFYELGLPVILEAHLRPATDAALRAANLKWQDEGMAKRTRNNRKRLDSLRIALGEHARTTSPQSFACLPKTRAARDTRM